jgi:hypothetical protein
MRGTSMTNIKRTGTFALPLSDKDDGSYGFARTAEQILLRQGLRGAASVWAEEAKARKRLQA